MASYPCTDDPREIIDAIVGAGENAEKFDKFVNGGVYEEVQLGAGEPTPTLRNLSHLVKSAATTLDGSDVSGKFSDAANGGTELRMLSDRFGDVVNVKDFGAVGDGVADDTGAIQDAADAALNKRLFFPAGTYKIEDTVHFYRACDIDLGGSAIVWDGESGGTMLHIDGCGEDDDQYGNTVGNIHDGAINGMWSAADGLILDCHGIRCHDMYIKNCTHDHLAIGHEATSGRRSLACHIYHVYIQCGEGASAWSDANAARGLAIYEADNKIEDLNVLACNKSVYSKVPGNTFVNCHLCAMYKSPSAAIGEDYAVFLDYYDPVGLYANVFVNCYFDNHKYVFYNYIAPMPSGLTDSEQEEYEKAKDRRTRQRIICSNSMYYNSGNQHTGDAFFSTHMLGGNPMCLSVDNFSVRQSARCRFFDAKLSSGPSMLMQSMIREQYAKNIDPGAEGRPLPYMAQYRVTPEDCPAVVRTGTELASGEYFCIGCVVVPNTTNLDRFGGATLEILDRSAGRMALDFWYNNGNAAWQYETRITNGNPNFNVAVGAPETIAVAGINSLMIPLYLRANAAISGTVVYARLRGDGAAACYLCGDVSAEWSSSSYVINASGSTAVGSGPNQYVSSLAQIGLTGNTTLKTLCWTMPSGGTGAFYLTSGNLLTDSDMPSGSGVKYLRIVKSGNGVCALECFRSYNSQTYVYTTFANASGASASAVTVNAWKEL